MDPCFASQRLPVYCVNLLHQFVSEILTVRMYNYIVMTIERFIAIVIAMVCIIFTTTTSVMITATNWGCLVTECAPPTGRGRQDRSLGAGRCSPSGPPPLRRRPPPGTAATSPCACTPGTPRGAGCCARRSRTSAPQVVAPVMHGRHRICVCKLENLYGVIFKRCGMRRIWHDIRCTLHDSKCER